MTVTSGETPSALTWTQAQRRIASLGAGLDPATFEAHFVMTADHHQQQQHLQQLQQHHVPDLGWEESDHADLPLPPPEIVAKLPQLLEAASAEGGVDGIAVKQRHQTLRPQQQQPQQQQQQLLSQQQQQQQQLVFLTGGSNPIEAGYGTLKIAEADAELTDLLRLTRIPLQFLKEEKGAEMIWKEHVSTLEAEER